VNARARQAEAIALRASGLSYREIASKLGFAGPSGAHKAASAALRDAHIEEATELRSLCVLRLEAMIASHWEKRSEVQTARLLLGIMAREADLLALDIRPEAPLTQADLQAWELKIVALIREFVPDERRELFADRLLKV